MDSEELLSHPALEHPAGQRILLLKGEGGRELLASTLRARGAEVVEFALYRRRPVKYDVLALGQRLRAFGASALLVASGETLDLLLGLLRQMPAGTIPAGIPVIAPGERVATLARAAGLAPVVVAANASDAAMLDALSILAARAAPTVEH
jgi:uroporphyrinogen-III synthase